MRIDLSLSDIFILSGTFSEREIAPWHSHACRRKGGEDQAGSRRAGRAKSSHSSHQPRQKQIQHQVLTINLLRLG